MISIFVDNYVRAIHIVGTVVIQSNWDYYYVLFQNDVSYVVNLINFLVSLMFHSVYTRTILIRSDQPIQNDSYHYPYYHIDSPINLVYIV